MIVNKKMYFIEDTGPVVSDRVISSAIQGMSITDMRRALDYVRTLWSTPGNNFFTTVCIPGTEFTIAQFAIKFVRGQHLKRYKKNS